MKQILLRLIILGIGGLSSPLILMEARAQVKIGDNPTTINSNAVLELESTDKGLLLPRVALTATNIAAPLSAHTAGMTVYNTVTAGSTPFSVTPFNVTPGVYYNDGTKWAKVNPIDSDLTYVKLTAPTGLVYSTSSWHEFRFQTEANDVLNEYNPTTGKFVAARDGLYTITVNLLGTCTTGQFDFTAFIDLNGAPYSGSTYNRDVATGSNSHLQQRCLSS